MSDNGAQFRLILLAPFIFSTLSQTSAVLALFLVVDPGYSFPKNRLVNFSELYAGHVHMTLHGRHIRLGKRRAPRCPAASWRLRFSRRQFALLLRDYFSYMAIFTTVAVLAASLLARVLSACHGFLALHGLRDPGGTPWATRFHNRP
ncbi:MAG: hypothetical protein V6Z86_01940 [Hyphomicrobiales bacterium]